jgi:hypothetical protein
MGNIFKKTYNVIYPYKDTDSDEDDENIYDDLKPSEIIKKEFSKNEKNNKSNDHILLRPSQIIELENEKIKKLTASHN